LRCLHHTGRIKTQPVKILLVRVKFTGNSYSHRTCVNVNGHKYVYGTATWTHTCMHNMNAPFETVTTKPNISHGVVRLLVKLHDKWLLSTSVYGWTQQRTSSTLHRRRWHNQPGTPTNHTTAHASEHPITRHQLLHICIITCASRHTDGHCSYVQ